MIKEEKRTQQISVYHRHCDVCDKEIPKGMLCSRAVCEICGIDLCESCIGFEVNTSGDYREVYCKSCWDIGEQYRPAIHLLESSIDKLYEKWHKECKENNEDEKS
ncbi:MAG: hypothetical protein EHM87_22350 [Burkholderiales bacterium]|nr:MAG: hypothetical protein EHM87_22350 [Burkholderiales bacterium]